MMKRMKTFRNHRFRRQRWLSANEIQRRFAEFRARFMEQSAPGQLVQGEFTFASCGSARGRGSRR
jgi:hypothetical protein